MKSSLHKRPSGYGVEWLQAVFTLLVLTGIYFSSGSYATTVPPSLTSEKSVEIAVPYWNDAFGYGFQWNPGDTYQSETASGVDQVSVSSSGGVIFEDTTVKVSFYKDTSIEDIEKLHSSDTSRAYSRLPTGIAVIEWDLASATAKIVLATLHSR
jgi:hypothetical protein